MHKAGPLQQFFLCGFVLLLAAHIVYSQSQPCSSSNTPRLLERTEAWPQNARVSVNFSTAFTTDQVNCMKEVFNNINPQNATGQGNASGVLFEVTHNSTPVATVGPSGATNAPGINYGLQINSQDLGNQSAGRIARGHNGTNRVSGVIDLTPRITNCTAAQMNLTHEVAHSLGLDHCFACNAGSSAANIIPCGSMCDWNNTTYGRTDFSPCDNSKVQQVGQYDPNTVNQPNPDPPDGGDGSGGTDCGCPDCIESASQCSPIILPVGQGANYRLTGPQDGVWFDIDGDGVAERVAWTAADEPLGFLALDRNQNGIIDDAHELFGDHTRTENNQPAANGFAALAHWDRPEAGGTGDGWIDNQDAVWPELQVWVDANHDGFTQPGELSHPALFKISRISAVYNKEMRRADEFGNWFRLRGEFIIRQKRRNCYDVWLVTQQEAN